MKPYLLLLFTVGLLSTSCTDRDDEVDAVNIRLKNLSGFTFDEVQVSSQDSIYTNIPPDTYSNYLEYETAYSYASVSIQAGEETFVLQPIDYVGEPELPIGFYTYELNVNEEGVVSLNFVAD